MNTLNTRLWKKADSCLVNLIDVTVACEDANSKLVEVFNQTLSKRSGHYFEVEVQARFEAGVCSVFCC